MLILLNLTQVSPMSPSWVFSLLSCCLRFPLAIISHEHPNIFTLNMWTKMPLMCAQTYSISTKQEASFYLFIIAYWLGFFRFEYCSRMTSSLTLPETRPVASFSLSKIKSLVLYKICSHHDPMLHVF